jgi:hypothetical protein
MSHANDAFAYALFIFTWHKTHGTSRWSGIALRGLTAGLCALVRQQNAIFVLFLLGELTLNGMKKWRQTRQITAIGKIALKMAVFSLAWWVAYAPQVIVWRIVFGHWIELNPYAEAANLGFHWLQPHLLKVLFSTNHGLFTWHPLLFPAVLGWFFLWKKKPSLSALAIITFVLELYVIASWVTQGGGCGFGERFFTNLVPAFILGLAALLNILTTRVKLTWLVAACAIFVAWNGLLITRYALEDIPRMGHVPLDELIVGQFTVVPRYFDRIIQILLTRS